MTVLLWIVALTGLGGRLLALGLLARLTGRRFRLDPAPPGPVAPVRVSILVPARDEEAVIDRLLDTLLAQDHPDLEILVVDDASTDRTGERLRARSDPRLRVLDGRPLPEGWTGKNNALDHAVGHATGELLLFVDADTLHHPAAARTVALEMEREGLDALVVLGRQLVPGPWEKLVNPFFWGFVLMFVDPDRSARPDLPDDALGNGQFAAFRREAYQRAGGHAAIRDRVIEDVALAKAVKRAGGRYRLRLGPNLTATRMYEGLGQIWRGFGKNAAFVDPRHKGRDAVLTLVGWALMFHAELWPWLALTLPEVRWVGAAQIAAVWATRGLVYRRLCDGGTRGVERDGAGFATNPLWYLLQPVGAAVALGITLDSLRRGLTGAGATWKGRVVRGPSL